MGGSYVQDTTFRYVGYGGDFDVVRRKRDFTCILGCCLLPLLLLLPCLLWWLCQEDKFDCDDGYATWEISWGVMKQRYCCAEFGRACQTSTTTTRPLIVLPTPTPPPTQAPTPPPA